MVDLSQSPPRMGNKIEPEKSRILRRVAQLRSERSSFDSRNRELSNFITPYRGRFFVSDRNRGERRDSNIMDNTASGANETLKSGMTGGITNPARQWFGLTVEDRELKAVPGVKQWLHEVTQLMNAAFQGSNFYDTSPTVYGDMATYATGCMQVDEDIDKILHCTEHPTGSYMIGTDGRRRVNVFAREWQMQIAQLIDEYGFDPGEDKTQENIHWERFSEFVKEQYIGDLLDSWVSVCNLIEPNRDFDPNRLQSEFKLFKSWTFEVSGADNGTNATGSPRANDDRFLRIKGYDIFPVLAPRWETTGNDIYGTNCPGIMAIGDTKQLQKGEKLSMKGVHKHVDPPMTAPADAVGIPISILPAEVSFVGDTGRGKLEAAHRTDFRPDLMESKQAQVRVRINRAYLVHLFQMFTELDRRQVTAREIVERQGEKIVQLGPTLIRVNHEFLEPLIDILFDIMFKQGLLPEAPPELQGVKLKVDFVSVLAQAQRLSAISNLDNFVQFVSGLAQLKPEALDNLDVDAMVKELADIFGVPPEVLVSEENVISMRQARAEAQAQQAQVLQAREAAAAAKDASAASLEDDNVLARISQAGALQNIA